MTTPTREQVIKWAKEAGIAVEVMGAFLLIRHISEDGLDRLCAIAMSAGRDQGLREAKEVCDALAVKVYDHAKPPYISCAAAIDQLRGK